MGLDGVAMETVEPYQEGAARITIGDLVKNALRRCPDRIVVVHTRNCVATSRTVMYGSASRDPLPPGLR